MAHGMGMRGWALCGCIVAWEQAGHHGTKKLHAWLLQLSGTQLGLGLGLRGRGSDGMPDTATSGQQQGEVQFCWYKSGPSTDLSTRSWPADLACFNSHKTLPPTHLNSGPFFSLHANGFLLLLDSVPRSQKLKSVALDSKNGGFAQCWWCNTCCCSQAAYMPSCSMWQVCCS